MYYFRPSNMGFYVEGKSKIPGDALLLTEEYYNELMLGISQGKHLYIDNDGYPYLTTVANIPLAQAVVEKRRDIEAWRDAQEQSRLTFICTLFPGIIWDLDRGSKSRLDYAYEAAMMGALPPGFFWTNADNLDVPMTPEQLIQFRAEMGTALVARGFQIHARQRQMKQDISIMSSVEEIQNYVIGWPE